MTFIQFAFNNVSRNLRQYVSYFVSCTFAVTVFFMFAIIVFHPDLHLLKSREIVRSAVYASEVLIYGFSFLFILYSTSAFVKSRRREFAVLMTLGMRKFQLNLMLFIENTIIALTAIFAGIGIGALLAKLFMMALAAVLGFEQALPFYFPATAVKWTFFLFFFMFEVTTVLVVMTMRNKPILHLLHLEQSTSRKPRFSFIISLLSVLAIGYAYYLAYTADLISMMFRMFPILALIVPGTYFFFSQFLIALTSIARRIPHLYFHGKNMLVFSDMSYKFRDNAKMLFFVTILSAVSFTSSGILYSIYNTVDQQIENYYPQDFSMISMENTSDFQDSVKKVENELQENGVAYKAMQDEFLALQLNGGKHWKDTPVNAHAYSNYVRLAALQHKRQLVPENEGKVLLLRQPLIPAYPFKVPSHMTLTSDHMNKRVNVRVSVAEDIYNSSPYGGYTVILPDDLFQELRNRVDKKNTHQLFSIEFADWRKEVNALIAIEKSVTGQQASIESKGSSYVDIKNGTSYFFFFGVFISILFFLAAGSILYFRMYQNIDKDLYHYRSLYRVGLTSKDMRRIATSELGYLFFIPFFIAALHAGFAYKALQNMLQASLFTSVSSVIGIFFILHLFNFIVIRNIYVSKLKQAMK